MAFPLLFVLLLNKKKLISGRNYVPESHMLLVTGYKSQKLCDPEPRPVTTI